MINAPKFTIILAGHQTAPYLPKALDSIARQTFTDFEAICYVEESTDNSLEICRVQAEKDSRFKVVSAPKSGAVATTRNYGIDHATGEYLVVVDGDDWIVPNMLERLAAKLNQVGEVDVLAFVAVSTETENVDLPDAPRITNFRTSDSDGAFTGLDAIRRTGRNGGSMHNFTWLNTYRTSFLRENGIRQTDGLLMEDMESTPRIWFAAKQFAYLDEVLYVYRRRPKSLTTESSPRIVTHIARQVRSLLSFETKQKIPADIKKIWSNQWLSVLYWFMFHPVSSRKISDSDRKSALDILFKDGGRKLFIRLTEQASLPKRIALPLILLASAGFQLPAKLFFRQLYYPLLSIR